MTVVSLVNPLGLCFVFLLQRLTTVNVITLFDLSSPLLLL